MKKREEIPVFYDTIEFEIDYLPKVARKLERFFQYGQNQNYRKRGAVLGVVLDFSIDNGSIRVFQTEDDLRGTAYDVHSDKRFYEFAPSSHYGINVMVLNKMENGKNKGTRCRFNFSIPKLVYGHNIGLFPRNKDGDKHQVYLWRFVDWFLYYYFQVGKVEANFELKSIHLCYNYRYDDEKSFEAFGRMQQIVYHDLKDNTRMNVYSSSVAKVIDGGYIKLYDKYKEFYESDGGFKSLVNYYYRKNVSLGLSKQYAKLSAIKSAEKVGEYARNVWRCEIELRGKLINYLFWQDYSSRFFLGKEKYVRRKPNYDLYMNISRSIKTYFDLRPLTTERKRKSYVKFLTKYGKYLYKNDLDGYLFSPVDLSFTEKMDEISLMKKFIRALIIDDYRKIVHEQRIRPVVSRLQASGDSSFQLMVLDDLIIQRGANRMAEFVGLFTKLANITKSVDLLTYLKLNKHDILDSIFLDENGNEKKITLKFYNAIISHLCKKKEKFFVIQKKNKTYYRNEKYCKDLAFWLGVAMGGEYRVKEIFNFQQNFMEKSVDSKKNIYICPIIDIMLNSILEEILHRTI